MKLGQIVKFTHPHSESEAAERFTVLELRGFNALVEFIGTMRVKPSFVYPLTDLTAITLEQTVEQMKLEILEDIVRGKVPKTVTSFSALHDYVDANEYGSFCDDAFSDALIAFFGGRNDDYGMPDDMMDYINAAQDAIDAWIKAGGIQL